MVAICQVIRQKHEEDGLFVRGDDPKFKAWKAENSIIMSWLLHSMQPEISKPLLFLLMAREI